MKKFIYTVALSSAFLSHLNADLQGTSPQAPQSIIPNDQAAKTSQINLQYSLDADKRHWNLGDEQKTDQLDIKRYVLDGETPDYWTELLTIHEYYGVSGDVNQFFTNFLKALQDSLPAGTKVESKIISQDKDSLLAEWWIPTGLTAQHEWIKVMTDGHNLVVMRYTTRKIKSVDAIRPTWEGILKNAKIVLK